MDSFNIVVNYESEKSNELGLQSFDIDYSKNFNTKGVWEVGLSEISFTNCVQTIEVGSVIFLAKKNNIEDEKQKVNYHLMGEMIEPGNYSVDQLINRINEISERFMKFYRESYPNDRYAYSRIKKRGKNLVISAGFSVYQREMFFIIPSKPICKILGFDFKDIYVETYVIFQNFSREWTHKQKVEYIDKNKDLTQKYPFKHYMRDTSLYVCSDICENSILGEVKSPILRYIDFDSLNDLSIKTLKFNKPYFVKCSKSEFKKIQIKLYRKLVYFSDSKKKDESYKMKFGAIKITLQFRKIS